MVIIGGNYMRTEKMEIKTIKAMFDACYQAKRVRELLPPLPEGVSPSYIHYLDTITMLEKKEIHVKVSDISEALSIPRPGVTRTVKEMESRGYLHKQSSESDGRITYLSLTEAGKSLLKKYDRQYFRQIQPFFDGITEEEADNMIRTIEKMYEIMAERSITIDE